MNYDRIMLSPVLSGEKSFEEIVVFDGEKVRMTTCVTRGFEPSTYKMEKDGDKLIFTADQVSAAEGKMHWEGDVREGWFKGVLIWTKPNEKERNFLFRGQRVKPETTR